MLTLCYKSITDVMPTSLFLEARGPSLDDFVEAPSFAGVLDAAGSPDWQTSVRQGICRTCAAAELGVEMGCCALLNA